MDGEAVFGKYGASGWAARITWSACIILAPVLGHPKLTGGTRVLTGGMFPRPHQRGKEV